MHDDEIPVDEITVRSLLRHQMPRWGDHPIRRVTGSGTVNAIFRIGDDLAARLPLRPRHRHLAGEREALEREARACAELARHAPVACPEPVAIGEPGAGYPLPWSMQTWVPGTVAEGGVGADSTRLAHDLATLVVALRAVDTAGRRHLPGRRGGDLRDHDPWVRTCLDESRGLLDVARLAAAWDRFRALPRSGPDVMSHGDLTPSNVLVDQGRLTGLLDGGGFGPADPALDVIAGWHLLDDGPRAAFRRVLAIDDLQWERSKAWAFEQSMGAVWYYAVTNPPMSEMGRRTLGRILAAE